MSSAARYLAIDLGAESGRAVVGELAGGRLTTREIHRFANRVVHIGPHLHWNVYGLWEEVLEAIRRASSAGELRSIGLDTWGVDFALLAEDGRLLGLPHTYRDPRTEGVLEAFVARVPRRAIYGRTGIQLLPFNTLFQLHSMARDGARLLDRAADLLFIPDLFHFWLTGRKATEFTFATTSQLYNPVLDDWDETLLRAAGVRRSLMQEIVRPGTLIGRVTREVTQQTGCSASVVAVGTHDTASAVAAVPAAHDRFAYISSGTWSLVGAEVAAPVLTDEAARLNFTNEGGVAGTFRLLKNVMGLWLVQGCRRGWHIDGADAYAGLASEAATIEPLEALIDPDHPSFFNPPDMVAAIEQRLVATGQRVNATPAAIVRCVLDSLALKYRMVLDELAALRGVAPEVVHVVGGGANNALLCQLTADASGIPVVAGPPEATAIGNIVVQAAADGTVDSVTAARKLVSTSCDLRRFESRDTEGWHAARERFADICRETGQ